MLLLKLLLQFHVLHLNILQVVLFPLELAHLRPVTILRICKFDSLRLNEAIDCVILLQFNDPIAETLRSF